MKVKRTGLANGLDVDVWEKQARPAHWLGGETIGERKVPASKGSESIFHNNSVRQVGISPFSKCGNKLREV